MVAGAGSGVGRARDLVEGDLDIDPQVDPDLADGVAEILEGQAGVAAGIHDKDAMAPAAHHFIESEIFEMASV